MGVWDDVKIIIEGEEVTLAKLIEEHKALAKVRAVVKKAQERLLDWDKEKRGEGTSPAQDEETKEGQ